MRQVVLYVTWCFVVTALTPGAECNPAAPPATSRQSASYFLGRHSYNPHDKVWGYVWRAGQSSRTARLVILNEQSWLAPDRAVNQFGVDDQCLYRLSGRFAGDRAYEPNTNQFYPELLLTGYALLEAGYSLHSPPNS